MNFKKIILILSIIFFSGCNQFDKDEKKLNYISDQKYSNTGFTLVYNDKLKKEKTISKIIDNRSLLIFHKRIKKNSFVKITNPINNKSIIAKVFSNNAEFPDFYNSVITTRIADELSLNPNEPYIDLLLISKNSTFIAKKAKTFEEEKNVANKAPVDEINIKNISINKAKSKKKNKDKNSYIIRVVDFYYLESANTFKSKLQKDLNLSNINIKEVSPNKFRVFCGPFNSLNDIKDTYLSISNLGFEQLDIIKIN